MKDLKNKRKAHNERISQRVRTFPRCPDRRGKLTFKSLGGASIRATVLALVKPVD